MPVVSRVAVNASLSSLYYHHLVSIPYQTHTTCTPDKDKLLTRPDHFSPRAREGQLALLLGWSGEKKFNFSCSWWWHEIPLLHPRRNLLMLMHGVSSWKEVDSGRSLSGDISCRSRWAPWSVWLCVLAANQQIWLVWTLRETWYESYSSALVGRSADADDDDTTAGSQTNLLGCSTRKEKAQIYINLCFQLDRAAQPGITYTSS